MKFREFFVAFCGTVVKILFLNFGANLPSPKTCFGCFSTIWLHTIWPKCFSFILLHIPAHDRGTLIQDSPRWFFTLYDTNLVKLIAGYLVSVSPGHVPVCAGADQIHWEIARNAVCCRTYYQTFLFYLQELFNI